MPPKIKLVLSDFHIGSGRVLPNGRRNELEDFFFDQKFVEFLQYYRTGDYEKGEVELIFNGDFFNHLQVDRDEVDPDLITEKVALRRTEAIFKGHPEVFQELKKFASVPGHRLTFLLGNHDPGLLFPSVVKKIQEQLGEGTSVRLDPYLFDGIHIEHGNQFFADNAFNQKRYFLTAGLKEPIVNLPWGSEFVIHFLNRIRRERTYFTKIVPFKHYLLWALVHDTSFAIRAIGRILFYFLKLRFPGDARHRAPLWQTIKIIKEVGLSPKLDREAKKLLLTQKNLRLVIFGHTHYPVIKQFAPDKTYINVGLWNEQVSLELTNPGRIVRLTYAQIDYDEKGLPHASLKEWKGSYRIIEELAY